MYWPIFELFRQCSGELLRPSLYDVIGLILLSFVICQTKPWSSLVEIEECSYLPNGQTNLVAVIHKLYPENTHLLWKGKNPV